MLESAYREANPPMKTGTYDHDACSRTIGNSAPQQECATGGVVFSLFGFKVVKSRAADRASLSVCADGLIIGAYQPPLPGRLSRNPKTRIQVDCLGCRPSGRHDGWQRVMV